jgi:hypothetical protein
MHQKEGSLIIEWGAAFIAFREMFSPSQRECKRSILEELFKYLPKFVDIRIWPLDYLFSTKEPFLIRCLESMPDTYNRNHIYGLSFMRRYRTDCQLNITWIIPFVSDSDAYKAPQLPQLLELQTASI